MNILPVEDPDGAIKLFQKLIDEYPDSPLVPYAEIGIGEAYLKKTEVYSAIEQFKSFLDRYPNHNKVPYVICKLSDSYLSLVSSVDRDLSPAKSAFQLLYRIKEEFPFTEECKDVDKKIKNIRILLAKKELYVARFYYKRENYQAAKMRAEEVVKNYSDLPQYKNALKMIRKIDKKTGLPEN